MTYFSNTKVTVDVKNWDPKNISLSTFYSSTNINRSHILNNSRIMYLKTPFMSCPFGASKPYSLYGEPESSNRWTIQMDLNDSTECQMFHEKITQFDDWLLNEASKTDNCVKWLKASKTKPFSREIIGDKYCHTLKYSSHGGETDELRPPFIRVRLPITSGEPCQLGCDVYDKKKKLPSINIDQISRTIPHNCWCSATIVGTLWTSSVGFGVVWYVKQLIVYPDQEAIPAIWKPLEIEMSDDDSDDDSDDEVAVKKSSTKSLCDDDSDDDNDVEVEIKQSSLKTPRDEIDRRIEKSEDDCAEVTLFNLKCNGPNTLFVAPSKYSIGETTTASMFDLYSRFCREMNGCFDEFDWDHVCVAGGILTGLVEKKYDPAVYAESDIDVFIYGSTVDEAKKHFMRVFKFFQNKFPDMWVVPLPWESIIVVNLCTEQLRRSIQLICLTGINNPRQLINNFDLSHCQIAFNGREFICTEECMKTLCSRQSQILGKKTSAYRLYKAYMRGFSVLVPNHPVHVKSQHDCKTEAKFSYGIDNSPFIDNLRDFTAEKLLTEANIVEFSRLAFNPRNKEQYLKNRHGIQYNNLNIWVTKYLNTHTPCHY